MTKQVLVPFGTRPEIIKLAPVVRALRAAGLGVRTVATGQQNDRAMIDGFFDELGLCPDERWSLDGDESERTGQLFSAAMRALHDADPKVDLVLLLGDTNTVPAFSIAARRNRIPVAHLEAGLRSFNETSVEEVNRRVAAACASLHFAPTARAAGYLRKEGIDERRISVVGNPVIDVLASLDVPPSAVHDRAGVVVTAHRATNVDVVDRLRAIVAIVQQLAASVGPVTFPVHPRTASRLTEFALWAALDRPGISTPEPLPYRSMIELIAGSQLVVTDSGGLQEEAAWFGVPVVILRRSTPRWEGIDAGTSVLAGLDIGLAVDAARKFVTADEQARVAAVPCPYGDGHTADRVAAMLTDPPTWDLLALTEPDFIGRPAPP